MCPGPWLTVTMGELSLCLGTPEHGAPLSRPVTPWQYDCMTVWLYDSMHDCIMTSDCMMTCDILTPVHGSSWQHTADTHFNCTSQCKYFTFRRSYYVWRIWTSVYIVIWRTRGATIRESKVNVRAGMWMKWWSCHIHVLYHNTLSHMGHVWMSL